MACGDPTRLDPATLQWYQTHGFHPTFYYEAAWNVVGFALLWVLGRRLRNWLHDGDVFCLYLIWYPLGRFWVEMFRPDAWRLGSLATAQWISIVAILIGIGGIILNHTRGEAAESAPSSAAQPPAGFGPASEPLAGEAADAASEGEALEAPPPEGGQPVPTASAPPEA